MDVERATRERLIDEVRRLERRLVEQTRIASYLSERQSQFLAEVLPQQMWTAGPDGSLDYVNAVVLEYFSRTHEQMIGQGWIDVVHPDDAASVVEQWTRSLQTGEAYKVEFRLRRHDGEFRWHVGRANAFRADGEIRRWYGSNTDVHDAVASTEALRRSESRHRLVSEAVTDGLWLWEIGDDAMAWNDRLREMFGVEETSGPLRLADWIARVHPGDRASLQRQLDDHLARRAPFVVPELRLLQGDGSYRFASARGLAEFHADGRPARMAGGVTDIDGVKRAEHALRFLTRASRLFSDSRDWRETLAGVARAAVPELADWCTIDLCDEAGEVHRFTTAHADPARLEVARELERRWPVSRGDPSSSARVVATGVAELHPVITDEMLALSIPDADRLQLTRRLEPRAAVIAPIVAHGRVEGAVTFVSAESKRRFDESDLTVACDLAQRAGAAIHAGRLADALAARGTERPG